MRQVGGHLEEFLEPSGVHLVAHQRQQDRQGECHRDGVQADDQGVGNGIGEHVGVEIPLKVFQPRPAAPPDAGGGTEILEGNDHAVHRQVCEADEDHDRRKHQQIEAPVSACPMQERRPADGYRSLHDRISPFATLPLPVEFIVKPVTGIGFSGSGLSINLLSDWSISLNFLTVKPLFHFFHFL